jgi:nucleoside-diphosphate-sugar epimerase
MRILFIGGTGLISSACSELALARGHELFVLNRGLSPKYPLPQGATLLRGDVRVERHDLDRLMSGLHFDAAVDFIAYSEQDIDQDLALLRNRTDQFVFISSASAYRKPPKTYLVTEATPLENPFWSYSRGKIAAEQRLMHAYRTEGFPATIVRPSLTYGPAQIPFCVGSWEHPWTIIARMRRGAKIIVPGDGTSLWVLTWNGDFARGLLGLLGNARAIGEAFQITSDEVLTWDQIFLEAFSLLDIQPNILHVPSDLIAAYWPHALGSLIGDKMHSVVFDNSKIKDFVPDYMCDVNWHAGLRRALDWHGAHPQFQTIDHEVDKIMDDISAGYDRASPGPR